MPPAAIAVRGVVMGVVTPDVAVLPPASMAVLPKM